MGYTLGRRAPWQVGWMICQGLVFKRSWLPARFRNSMLRAFGATIGDGVLIRHDVTIHWPWKLVIGDHSSDVPHFSGVLSAPIFVWGCGCQ